NIGNKKIKRVYGDGACDMRENFNYLNSEEIEPARAFLSGVKRIFGETTKTKTKKGKFQEVKMKFVFYNVLISL
ncbi:MAG: hypothetical protein QXN45_00005, partial [Candidatus Thermoplasmatota archaeon]